MTTMADARQRFEKDLLSKKQAEMEFEREQKLQAKEHQKFSDAME